MQRSRKLLVGATLVAVITALGAGQAALQAASQGGAADAPSFEVDPFWPRPLPNHWILGSVIGIGIDARDHVFIVHRQASLNARTEVGAAATPPTGECCLPAPPCGCRCATARTVTISACTSNQTE